MGNAKRNTVQGEGDRESAKRYNEATQDFVESGKVEEAAEKASEQSKDEAESAEAKGRSRAKEFDPQVERDFSKGKPS